MSLLDHLEHLRARPEHTRRQVAFGSAVLVTVIVAFGWIVAFVSSDTLALDTGGVPTNLSTASQGAQKDFSNLLGAANAFQSAVESGPGISVVETNVSSTLPEEQQQEATSIPF